MAKKLIRESEKRNEDEMRKAGVLRGGEAEESPEINSSKAISR